MRVVLVHPSLNSCGGAERVCLAFAEGLLEAGHEVAIATVDKIDWGLLRKVFGRERLPVEEYYLFVRLPRENAVFRGFFTVSCYLFLLFLVRCGRRFDLMIGTSGELVDSVSDIVYVNALPLRLIHRYSGIHVEKGVYWRCFSRLYDLFLRVLGRVRGARLILTNSRFNREVIRRELGLNALILYPPVNVDEFRALVYSSNREDLVVTVSRFRPGKVLEVVPRVARLVKDAKFLIVGSKSEGYEEVVEALRRIIGELGVDDRVELRIGGSRSEVLEALGRARVYLHTQPYEAFGIAVVEAMAAGCVPVVPEVGGPWSDLLAERQGLYGYSYRNVEEAAREVKAVIKDRNLWEKISERAVKRAEKFDAVVFREKVVHLIDLFKRILHGR